LDRGERQDFRSHWSAGIDQRLCRVVERLAECHLQRERAAQQGFVEGDSRGNQLREQGRIVRLNGVFQRLHRELALACETAVNQRGRPIAHRTPVVIDELLAERLVETVVFDPLRQVPEERLAREVALLRSQWVLGQRRTASAAMIEALPGGFPDVT